MEISKLLMSEMLPKKELLSGAEAAHLLDTEADLIFFWESEFPQIRSQKSPGGPRFYNHEDLVLLFAIKELVVEKELSIAVALKMLAELDDRPLVTPKKTIPLVKADMKSEFLLRSSLLLAEEEPAFDETTHQIYQECKDVMDEVFVTVDPEHVGEMIADALKIQQLRKERDLHQKKRAVLMDRKNSLHELLSELDKFEGPAIVL